MELGSSRERAVPSDARRRVALVVMPAQVPSHPSLALATLAAELRRRGHEAEVHYLNVEAASVVGMDTYLKLGLEDSWVHKVSEWLFSHPGITPGAADVDTMRRFLKRRRVSALSDLDFDRLRATYDRLLEKWTEEIPWSSYDVVGFTVMFQQLNASLRLARAIKDRASDTRVVLGGSGLEDPMGGAVFGRYPFLDAVFSGYAERSFPAWVERLPPRGDGAISDYGVQNLDDLPVPTFDGYVAALERYGLAQSSNPKILIETSRGCWYGEKQHCTFCGINGTQMKYRHKSGDRVFDEVRALARYGLPLWAADNIMPLEYYETLFPRLEHEGVRFDGFYEIKSNAKRAELETLARVGITRLQPGIESFSSKILKRMKKGVTGIQNVWFLRASVEIGLECKWNLLWGFPGEETEEYEETAVLFPKLGHLKAPEGFGKIHLLRHSPNHTRASEIGFSDVRPFPSYALAFGPHERLAEQAYLFEFGYADGRDPDAYTRGVAAQANRWITLERRGLAPICQAFSVLGQRFLVDTRRRRSVGVGRPHLRRLDDDEWALLEALESPIPRVKLEREWRRAVPLSRLLERFLRDDWAIEGDGRVVRLVVLREDHSLVAEAKRLAATKARSVWAAALRYA